MPFLIRSDYDLLIKPDLLNALTEGKERLRLSAELTAQSELETFLRGRYDVAAIFGEVLPWAAGRQYAAGAVVWYQAPAVAPGPNQVGQPIGDALLYVARSSSKGETPDPANTPEVVAELELEEPVPAGPAWVQQDPRHALMVTSFIDVVLYHLHSRQNPNNVPELRMARYDAVIDWLKAARAGKMSPGLPPAPVKLEDGTLNPINIRPRGGSLPKLTNAY